MTNNSGNEDLEILLKQYNHQIDVLKEKLLNGVSWDELVNERTQITQLAVSIRKFIT